jgi:hypothetical protein
MLPPAAVKVLSGIAGFFVIAATLVVGVPAIILTGLFIIINAPPSWVLGFRYRRSLGPGLDGRRGLLYVALLIAALATVFIRFGWDLFSQFIKP